MAYFESEALKKALEKAVKETTYQLKGVRRKTESEMKVDKKDIKIIKIKKDGQ